MKLFNSMVSKAFIIEEMARRSKFEDFFQVYRLKREIEDKQLGIARPLVFEFILNFLKEKGMVPEGTKFQGALYAAQVGQFIKNLIDAGDITPDIKGEFDTYLDENLGKFVQLKQQLRTKGKGAMVGKVHGSKEEFEKYGQIKSKEDFAKDLEAKRTELKAANLDTANVDIAELKLKILPKFENPKLRQLLIDTILETETDDDEQAYELAEDAISSIVDSVSTATNIDDILNTIENLLQSGSSAKADLAEALFRFIKKIVKVEGEGNGIEDEEEPNSDSDKKKDKHYDPDYPLDPREGPYNEPQEDLSYGESYSVNNYVDLIPGKRSKQTVIFESSKQKFKPKNVHQLIQRQYEL